MKTEDTYRRHSEDRELNQARSKPIQLTDL